MDAVTAVVFEIEGQLVVLSEPEGRILASAFAGSLSVTLPGTSSCSLRAGQTRSGSRVPALSRMRSRMF
jgi:hypothetical protein